MIIDYIDLESVLLKMRKKTFEREHMKQKQWTTLRNRNRYGHIDLMKTAATIDALLITCVQGLASGYPSLQGESRYSEQ